MEKQLELTIESLGNRETVRANTQRGEEIVKIPLNKVVIRKDFNVREDYGDIASLSQSIKYNGQLHPGRVDVLKNGTFVITAGHRRFAAIKLLNDPAIFFKAIVNGKDITEEDRLVLMFTDQDQKHLEPNEAAVIIQRLLNLGKTQGEIAMRIGRSQSYISQMIQFSREDKEVKDLVKSGKASISTVLKAKKEIKNKSERTEKIKTAAAKTGKITLENLTGESERDKKIKKLADLICLEFSINDTVRMIDFLKENY